MVFDTHSSPYDHRNPMTTEIHQTPKPQTGWRQRYTMISLATLAVFVCYIDRVNISVAIIPMAEDLEWDKTTQGWVMSSFFIGYLVTMVFGGWLADRFGGKKVLAAGVLLWSLFTMITPPAASVGLLVLLIVRIAMGMGEAVTFPSIYSLVGRWMPTEERSRSIGLINSGIPMGTMFALLVTPIIVGQFGWQWAFYSFGIAGFLWWLAWQPLVASGPEEHPSVSELERAEIAAGLPPEDPNAPPAPSIRELLTKKPVWAIIVAHFCNNWSLYVLLSWLPTFVSEGLGVPYASVGYVSMLPHLSSLVALNLAGYIADQMIKNGMNITKVRKTMQTIGFLGIATALAVVGEVDSVWLAIGIMCIGNAVGACVTGGFASNHMDLAPRHAGKLMGLTNTAGTIPGIIGVTVTGMILQATNNDWALVFQVGAGVTIFGLVFYLLFASGEKIYD